MSTPSPIDETPHRPIWAQDAARADRRRAPSFKTLILNLIVLGIVTAVISFFAAPAVTFYGVKAAAETGDVAGLAKLIDYDAVRSALRPQISGRVEPLSPPPSILQDPIGAIRRQFDSAVTPRAADAPDVDVYLTPKAIAALTRGQGRAAPYGGAGLIQSVPRPIPIYWSINRARLGVTADGSRTVFTFERRGPFEWKLVHIGLPDAPTPTPTPAVTPQP